MGERVNADQQLEGIGMPDRRVEPDTLTAVGTGGAGAGRCKAQASASVPRTVLSGRLRGSSSSTGRPRVSCAGI